MCFSPLVSFNIRCQMRSLACSFPSRGPPCHRPRLTQKRGFIEGWMSPLGYVTSTRTDRWRRSISCARYVCRCEHKQAIIILRNQSERNQSANMLSSVIPIHTVSITFSGSTCFRKSFWNSALHWSFSLNQHSQVVNDERIGLGHCPPVTHFSLLWLTQFKLYHIVENDSEAVRLRPKHFLSKRTSAGIAKEDCSCWTCWQSSVCFFVPPPLTLQKFQFCNILQHLINKPSEVIVALQAVPHCLHALFA